MWTSLRIATLGVLAQQQVLEVVSNNVANLNRTGFKKQRPDLADAPPSATAFGVGTDPGPLTLGQAAGGGGAIMVGLLTDREMGAARPTDQPLDFMINGNGFVPVVTESGQEAFTRNGALRMDASGQFSISGVGAIVPRIVLPPDAKSAAITADGSIKVTRADGTTEILDRIQLTRFANPEGLVRVSDELLMASPSAGASITGFPGEDGLGTLSPGMLEASNVDFREEMVRVFQAQRAYQMNLRSLKAADEMLQAASNLQR